MRDITLNDLREIRSVLGRSLEELNQTSKRKLVDSIVCEIKNHEENIHSLQLKINKKSNIVVLLKDIKDW